MTWGGGGVGSVLRMGVQFRACPEGLLMAGNRESGRCRAGRQLKRKAELGLL